MTADRACSTAAFISRSSAFISVARRCRYCSFQEGQLAQLMDGTNGMAAARVPLVRLAAVMNAHPREVRQGAHGVGGFAAALGMHRIAR